MNALIKLWDFPKPIDPTDPDNIGGNIITNLSKEENVTLLKQRYLLSFKEWHWNPSQTIPRLACSWIWPHMPNMLAQVSVNLLKWSTTPWTSLWTMSWPITYHVLQPHQDQKCNPIQDSRQICIPHQNRCRTVALAHSFQVWACILLNKVGKNPSFIQKCLQWLGNHSHDVLWHFDNSGSTHISIITCLKWYTWYLIGHISSLYVIMY